MKLNNTAMNTNKLPIWLFAFLIGIVSAFTADALNKGFLSPLAFGYSEFGQCELGDLLDFNCAPQTIGSVCRVKIGDFVSVAYGERYGLYNCGAVLFKPY